MTHPQDLSLRDQASGIASGELDAAAVIQATLERIEERNSALNAIVATFPAETEQMLAEAPEGKLHGVPIVVKDQFRIPWRGPRDGTEREILPAGDSGIFRRLKEAGAVVVAVANMHYKGGGSTGAQSAYGPVGNPWNAEHVGGGSSGGPACAVGARMIAGSVGADGGGSIRLPAAYCGVTGIKPTFGAVPVDGNVHGYSPLDALGPFGRDSDDARLLLEALSARELPPGEGANLKVGIPTFLWEDLDPEVESACRSLVDAAGWQMQEVRVEAEEHVRMATVLHLAIDALPQFPDDVNSSEALVRAYDRFTSLIPAIALVRADRVRAAVRRSLAEIFGQVDILVAPTVPAPAPPIANPTVTLPSGEHPPDRANVKQTGLANLSGLPAMNVPAGLHASGLPIGLQLIGPWQAEARLLDAAKHIEQATSRQFVDAVPQAYL